MNNRLYNIHTHIPAGNDAFTEIENLRFGQEASGKTPFCSAGLHPWFVREDNLPASERWLKAQTALTSVCAIGEAGLDKVCDTPWALQESAFRFCIGMSEEAGKPLVIHCVRAYNEVLLIKKQVKPTQPWIFHGFNKHPDTAQMLLREGCFLSFGAALLHENSHSAAALRQTPADRFFLETDDAEEVGIESIYERAAAVRGCSMDEIVAAVSLNVQRVFRL
jgi:TatD DNase family protein